MVAGRQFRKEGGTLRHEGIPSGAANFPGVGMTQAGGNLQQGGLSLGILSCETKNLARIKVKADLAQNLAGTGICFGNRLQG